MILDAIQTDQVGDQVSDQVKRLLDAVGGGADGGTGAEASAGFPQKLFETRAGGRFDRDDVAGIATPPDAEIFPDQQGEANAGESIVPHLVEVK